MPPIEIRRLTVSDVQEYRRVRLSTLATEPDYFGSLHEIEAVRPIADFEHRLASALVFGACNADGIVGVAHFQRATGPKEVHKGMVQGFFVEPDWRHHGIGAALMTTLITAAREHVEQLMLTVTKGNTAATSLYERFGFTAYGVELRATKTARGYRDLILMKLFLD